MGIVQKPQCKVFVKSEWHILNVSNILYKTIHLAAAANWCNMFANDSDKSGNHPILNHPQAATLRRNLKIGPWRPRWWAHQPSRHQVFVTRSRLLVGWRDLRMAKALSTQLDLYMCFRSPPIYVALTLSMYVDIGWVLQVAAFVSVVSPTSFVRSGVLSVQLVYGLF